LEFYFRFPFWPIHRTRHVTLHQAVEIQIGSCSAELWCYIDFQANEGANILPVSDSLTSVTSEGQCLSANQTSQLYLNPQLRYSYIRFGKTNVRHIGILFPVSILTISPQSACHCAQVCQISSECDGLRQKNDVMSIFKMPNLCHLGF